MAAVATSLFRSNTSSRIWDGRCPQYSPCHIAGTSKSGAPAFLVDSREANATRPRKMRLQLARASPRKGNTREVLQNVEHQNSNLGVERPLRSAQDTEDQTAQIDEDENRADMVRHTAEEKVIEIKGTAVESKLLEERDACANGKEDDFISGDTAMKGSILAGLLLVGVVGGFGAVSYLYKDQINEFLIEFANFIEGYGAAGYALFIAVYAGLEILAIPAIPLTMSAGLLFGTLTGTIIVSVSGTIAATAAFLIARYLARDRILKLAEGNKKFLAIDKAIGENGFRVVVLLRLSPLLPFSLGNYLYGLTSVNLVPYVLGSWLGMLPGTWAYVSAGAIGRAIIQEEAENGKGGGPEQLLTLGLGLLATVFAATYVTRLAKVGLFPYVGSN